MAKRDGNRPQLDFPELTADLIDQLRIRGPVGLLDFADVVNPVFLIGSRGVSFEAEVPVFTSSQIVNGRAFSPLANFTIFDTLGLPAGLYDIWACISFSGTVVNGISLTLEHRDAANAVTLATLLELAASTVEHAGTANLPLIGYEIAENERFRLRTPQANNFSGSIAGSIGFRLRPVP